MDKQFLYEQAFYRNLGWVTDWEQALLKNKKIAIAGMGGVGGNYILTLARLGIGKFNISDMDIFEVGNFNRQSGAFMSTINKPKVEVMEKMALDINPEAEITTFPKGINDNNIDNFLDGVDLYVDGIDLFENDIRAKIFARCGELKIPAVTCAPVGTGAAYITFMPGKMTFEEYFKMEGKNSKTKLLHFLIGLAPKGLHRNYLVDYSRINFDRQDVCSTPMGCQISSGIVATEALKILLRRGEVKPAPYYHQFDAYRGKYICGKLKGGNNNWLQKLKIIATSKLSDKLVQKSRPPSEMFGTQYESDIKNILDLARWAPSGDNDQPWQFKITSADSATVYVKDLEKNIYCTNKTSLLMAGFLMESLRIAASKFGRKCEWSYQELKNSEYIFKVTFKKQKGLNENELLHFLPVRSVNRRAYHNKPLTSEVKMELEKCLGDNLVIKWLSERKDKLEIAKISMLTTDIRAITPECHAIHKKVFDFKSPEFSSNAMPAKALGLSDVTLFFLRWTLNCWRNANFINKLPGFMIMPKLEADYIPATNCATHFIILPKNSGTPMSEPQIIKSGMALQNFWLTATKLGLAMQPNYVPIAFSWYAKNNISFTAKKSTFEKAKNLANKLENIATTNPAETIFMGRLGEPKYNSATSRSLRKPLDDILR